MPITNSTQNVLAYGWNGTNPVRMEVNSSGHQKVNVENALTIDTTGLATSTGQATGNGHLSTIAGDTTSLDTKVTACDTGAVVVSSSALPTGGATSALQTAGNSSLSTIAGDTTSLDGKVTACDTGAVVVSSSALPTGGATSALQTAGNSSLSTIAGDTTSLDGKVTACDTGAVVVSSSALPTGGATSALQTAGNSSLTSIDGKITACDTGAVVVSNNTDPATSTKQDAQTAQLSTIAGDTTSLDGKITQGSDATLTNAQQALCYGRDSGGTLDALRTDAQGHLEVVVDDFVKGQATMTNSFPVTIASDQTDLNIKINAVSQTGSYQNLNAGTSLTAGSETSAVDITNVKNVNIVYEDSATSSFDGLDVLVSGNGGSNYNVVSQLFPATSGSIRFAFVNLNVGGLDRIKLKNTSSTDTYTSVSASAFGSL